MSQFEHAIQSLENRRDALINTLKSEPFKKATLDQKLEIEQAIGCLKLCARYGIKPNHQVIELPKHTKENYGEFFEYHIMNDNERDFEHWTEVVDASGEPITAWPGDLVIIK